MYSFVYIYIYFIDDVASETAKRYYRFHKCTFILAFLCNIVSNFQLNYFSVSFWYANFSVAMGAITVSTLTPCKYFLIYPLCCITYSLYPDISSVLEEYKST